MQKELIKLFQRQQKKKTDDILEKIAKQKKINIYRGDNSNLVNRLYFAAKKCEPAAVVRITADCPLLSPKILRKLINLFRKKGADYAATSKHFAHGLDAEIFKFKLLKDTKRLAKKKLDKEHPTQLILRNQKYKKVYLKYKKDISYIRLTLDTPRDLVFLKKINSLFNKKIYNFEYDKIIQIISKNNYLLDINKKIKSHRGLMK